MLLKKILNNHLRVSNLIYCFFVGISNAQNAKITGKVVDAKNNEAIAFANVYIQNTTIGTTTDIVGRF